MKALGGDSQVAIDLYPSMRRSAQPITWCRSALCYSSMVAHEALVATRGGALDWRLSVANASRIVVGSRVFPLGSDMEVGGHARFRGGDSLPPCPRCCPCL